MSNIIKKGTAAVFGAVAMIGAATAANAADQYANVQLANADVTGMNSGSAFVGTLGFNMPQVNPYFSFEGELTKTLGKPSDSYNYSFFGSTYSYKAETDYWTLAGYGVITYPLNDKFSVRGRLGFLYEHVNVKVSDSFSGNSATGSATDTGLSYGVGATYKLSPTMNLIAEYTQIESDIDHLSAGVQFAF